MDSTNLQENAPNSQAEPSQKKGAPQAPTALRERGSGGEALLLEKRPLPQNLLHIVSSGGSAREGKGSHSRQWRLSMAVFLNRNKRPQAAPIEVAELLSEKPPPPEFSASSSPPCGTHSGFELVYDRVNVGFVPDDAAAKINAVMIAFLLYR